MNKTLTQWKVQATFVALAISLTCSGIVYALAMANTWLIRGMTSENYEIIGTILRYVPFRGMSIVGTVVYAVLGILAGFLAFSGKAEGAKETAAEEAGRQICQHFAGVFGYASIGFLIIVFPFLLNYT